MTNLYRELSFIHAMVMKNFKYVTDQAQHGIVEKWSMPGEFYNGRQQIVGDCEDFVLACRKLCRDRNIPSRIVFCLTEMGEGHAVLEVQGWILDNRKRAVEVRNHNTFVGYQWIKISGYNPGDPWNLIVG